MTEPYLTKSRTAAGLQCLRRLWLRVAQPFEEDPPESGSPRAVGAEIASRARGLFAGGVAVEGGFADHAQAVARTRALMADRSVAAIFNAAFDHDGVRIRACVLVRTLDGWALYEVKAATRVKDHYLDDMALLAHVIIGAGVALRSAHVMHVNTAYTRGAGAVDWAAFFSCVEVSEMIAPRRAQLPERLRPLRAALALPEAPAVAPGRHCHTPYGCEFWEDCTRDKPSDWIEYLPRLPASRKAELASLGIAAIADIPPEFPLSAQQAMIRDATATGVPYVAPDLGRLLGVFAPPACYLDFEAMMPPIPLYPGTHPYQTIPFQWSLHAIDADGVLHHRAFLADGTGDPRRGFAETLVDALAQFAGPVIVYSSYERTRLRALAEEFPALEGDLHSIIDRLQDLLPVVRSGVYMPAFGFSNSIKFVAPALAPGFGYDDLDGIADGMAAASAFLALASGAIGNAAEIARLRAALLAYCERDTIAMVEVHRALIRLAYASGGGAGSALPDPA